MPTRDAKKYMCTLPRKPCVHENSQKGARRSQICTLEHQGACQKILRKFHTQSEKSWKVPKSLQKKSQKPSGTFWKTSRTVLTLSQAIQKILRKFSENFETAQKPARNILEHSGTLQEASRTFITHPRPSRKFSENSETAQNQPETF